MNKPVAINITIENMVILGNEISEEQKKALRHEIDFILSEAKKDFDAEAVLPNN